MDLERRGNALRVLAYCSNGYGLGHLSRTTALLYALQMAYDQRKRKINGVYGKESLFAILTDADSIWPVEQFGIPMFKLPSKAITANIPGDISAMNSLFRNCSQRLISEFKPDILLLDTILEGVYGEFLDGKLLKSHYSVFVNRERNEHALADSSETELLTLVKHVVVPHRTGEAKVLASPIQSTDWVGSISLSDFVKPLSRSEARDKLGIQSSEEAILLCPGILESDRDRQEFVAVVKALCAVRPSATLYTLGKSGSNYGIPITVFPALEYFAAFDYALGAGSYNTLHELLFACVPSAFYPKARVLDDQNARIKRYVTDGACLELNPNSPLLVNQIEALFQPSVSNELKLTAIKTLQRGGSGRAASLILERFNAWMNSR